MSSDYSLGISPLGTYGLGTMGGYGSYDAYMPSFGMGIPGMYGMNGMNDMYGMSGMGMMGMMPQYYMQMGQIQAQMEKNKAAHSADMHSVLMQNEVLAHRETDSMLISKIITNGDVQNGIKNLHDKVIAGDQDGICHEFDKLENYIFNTYKEELSYKGGQTNARVNAREIIESIYGSMFRSPDGSPAVFREDVVRYGDNAFTNGFMQSFKAGHHERYVDETLNHCLGLDIDRKGAKDEAQTRGKRIGSVAYSGRKGLLWAGYGAAAYAGVNGIGKLITLPFKNINFLGIGSGAQWLSSNLFKFSLKGLGSAAIIAGLAGLVIGVGDKIWKADNKTALA